MSRLSRHERIPLGISREEIEIALAREKRPVVRKRLMAIAKVLAGKSIAQAARSAKVSYARVWWWLERVRQSGLVPLLHEGRYRRRKWTMTAADIDAARREIAAALKRRPERRLRRRLEGGAVCACVGDRDGPAR